MRQVRTKGTTIAWIMSDGGAFACGVGDARRGLGYPPGYGRAPRTGSGTTNAGASGPVSPIPTSSRSTAAARPRKPSRSTRGPGSSFPKSPPTPTRGRHEPAHSKELMMSTSQTEKAPSFPADAFSAIEDALLSGWLDVSEELHRRFPPGKPPSTARRGSGTGSSSGSSVCSTPRWWPRSGARAGAATGHAAAAPRPGTARSQGERGQPLGTS